MEIRLLCIVIGRRAKKALEEARTRVARAIGCRNKEIYFTSGGSESDNIAVKGVAFANREKGNHIITTKIEHPAILNTCRALESQGFDVTYLNVDKDGLINLKELEEAITNKTMKEIETEFEGKGYGDFKTAVANSVIEKLKPIQDKYKEILNNKEYLEKVYTQGAENARKLASKTLEDVKSRIGIL